MRHSQSEQAAEILARAMQHSPYMRYILGDDARMRHPSAVRYYQSLIRLSLYIGEATTTPDLDGIAAWIDSRNNRSIFGTLLKSGYFRAVFSLGLSPILRLMAVSNFREKIRSGISAYPCWLLIYLGVEPSRQRKGIGGLLLQPILSRANAQGMACMVETSNQYSLPFYKRHGFGIEQVRQVPGGGFQVWRMVRKPSSRSAASINEPEA